MAKTRAQRKAERRRREQAQQRQGGAPQRDEQERAQEERAQEDTQRGVSGEVAEAEAVLRTGADPSEYGEHTVERPDEPRAGGDGSPVPGVLPSPVEPVSEPEAPAPSRADVGRVEDGAEAPPKETRESRRDRRKKEKEERRKA